ncbi:family 43 glycosylhydrolase [Shewanella avicenniae]|uniref:Family 43 glycosylhydrolase n=1 Tax=Shewanella avicenniae TaxID=2814294 RepID=A0ABX7QNM3_9GAMM|nr:family 43 glycosylhydrolase [Shewanella avicenniae]QSX32964.1 family 43 glycosylhydrolase [Shewanella avicenniae]
MPTLSPRFSLALALVPALLLTPLAHANDNLNIDNPIVTQQADPFIYRDPDTGCYDFIATSPKFDQLEIRQACQLNDLKIAEPKVVWRKNDSGPMSDTIWAPELHRIDGVWYIYVAAGIANKPGNIRMYVLSNPSKDPTQGKWKEEGRIQTPWDSFSLDATTFEHKGKRYLLWAQQDKARSYNSALWIAEMDTPTSITGPVVKLTEPELDWEIQGYKVNEGPAVIERHGRVFVTYSASATDERYAMGLLWADADSDLLNSSSWQKSPKPVFTTNAEVGRYGPGHNSFVLAEDGKTDLMIYHSRNYQQLRGNPLTDPNRHARARALYWDANGFPVFHQEQGD